jgi:hypothetical protein
MDHGGVRAGCDFFSNGELLATLAELAVRKSDRFAFRPRLPLFVPGEALEFDYTSFDSMAAQPAGEQLHVRVTSEDGAVHYDQTGVSCGTGDDSA